MVVNPKEISVGFEGASLKVERAFRHFQELNQTMAVLNSPAYLGIRKKIQSDNSVSIGFADFGQAEPALAAILGDLIHNLRAAFDHMWMGLFRACDCTGSERNSFPFHKTRQNVEDALKYSSIVKAIPGVPAYVMDRVKPYADCGGNEIIWAITKFDNIDKHNLIIPAFRVIKTGTILASSGGVKIQLSDTHILGSSSDLIASYVGDIDYNDDGNSSVDIFFRSDGPLGGQAILPTALNMAQATREAVQLFGKTFINS